MFELHLRLASLHMLGCIHLCCVVSDVIHYFCCGTLGDHTLHTHTFMQQTLCHTAHACVHCAYPLVSPSTRCVLYVTNKNGGFYRDMDVCVCDFSLCNTTRRFTMSGGLTKVNFLPSYVKPNSLLFSAVNEHKASVIGMHLCATSSKGFFFGTVSTSSYLVAAYIEGARRRREVAIRQLSAVCSTGKNNVNNWGPSFPPSTLPCPTELFPPLFYLVPQLPNNTEQIFSQASTSGSCSSIEAELTLSVYFCWLRKRFQLRYLRRLSSISVEHSFIYLHVDESALNSLPSVRWLGASVGPSATSLRCPGQFIFCYATSNRLCTLLSAMQLRTACAL
jgi:hypothetical protein